MLDPDAPSGRRIDRNTTGHDIAPGVHEEARRAGGAQHLARPRHRPSLDDARRVDRRRARPGLDRGLRAERGVERTVALEPHLVAQFQYLAHERTRAIDRELAAPDPHD